jgi:hypothetical protein
MELYSGRKMAHDKYKKTNVARSIDWDSTVSIHNLTWRFIAREHSAQKAEKQVDTIFHITLLVLNVSSTATS